MYSYILQDFNLKDEDILNVYPYGSHVYGTNNKNSDYDFIVVCKDNILDRDSLDSSWRKLNATIYSHNSFMQKINLHKISALECVSLPENTLLKFSKNINFTIDKKVLRESISEKASHSWVKSKKKFEVILDKDIYIAKKSLFHSLRIINFGIQIANYGKIKEYSCCNDLWQDIYSDPNENWEPYKEKYQNYFNSQMTEFRKVAPK